jgi:hypothetical protein
MTLRGTPYRQTLTRPDYYYEVTHPNQVAFPRLTLRFDLYRRGGIWFAARQEHGRAVIVDWNLHRYRLIARLDRNAWSYR